MRGKKKMEKKSKSLKSVPLKTIVVFVGILLFLVISLAFFYQSRVQLAAIEPRSVITIVDQPKVSGLQAPVLSLDEDEVYMQEVKMVSREMTGFSLFIVNDDNASSGKILVSLKKKGEEQSIQAWEYDVSEFPFQDFCNFELNQALQVNVGDVYIVEVSVAGADSHDIRLQQAYRGGVAGKLFIDSDNGEELIEQEGMCLAYRINSGQCNAIKYFYLLVSVGILFSVILFFWLAVKRVKIEKITFAAVIVLGSLYMLVISPYAVPDEGAHFVTAYGQSSMILGRQVTDEDGRIVADSDGATYLIRESIPDATTYTNYIRGMAGKSIEITDEQVSLRSPIEMRQLGYAPQVLGITIGRLLGANGIQIFVLGRLFALLTFAMLVSLAVKIMPVGKMVMFIVGSLPMTLQQAMSFSYDSMLNGVLFLLIAYILYLAFEKEKVTWKDGIIISVMLLVIIPIKFIYITVLGLGLVIPKKKFGGIKNKISFAVFVLAFGIALTLFMRASTLASAVVRETAGGSTELAYYGISYCIMHPIETFEIILNTITENYSFYIETMVGEFMGWLDIEISGVIIAGFLVLLLFSAVLNPEKGEEIVLARQQKRILIGITFATVLAVMIVFLISETYIGSDTILGMQGRYFLPVLPTGLLALQNSNLFYKKNIDNVFVIGSGLLNLMVIAEIMTYVISR